jgi:hypothetical protein
LDSAAGGGSSPTLDIKLTECATTGGTYTDLSGATFTQVTVALLQCKHLQSIKIQVSVSLRLCKQSVDHPQHLLLVSI